jgi:hypothetical protein
MSIKKCDARKSIPAKHLKIGMGEQGSFHARVYRHRAWEMAR